MRRQARGLAVGVAAITGLSACGPRAAETAGAMGRLPTIEVEEVVGPALDEEPSDAPVAVRRSGERVTLTATGAELASVLAVVADAAGVSLVVAPEVRSRVTVHLEDVPAEEALRRLIAETGLMVRRRMVAPWGPTVFYLAPVNVDAADAAAIQARFEVSAELARFLVQSRIP